MRTIGTPSTQARKLNAIASGALPNGDPVVVNADGTVSVVGVDNDAAPSIGPETVFNTGSYTERPVGVYDASANRVVLAYTGNSTGSARGHAIVGQISGSNITFGTTVIFNSGSVEYIAIDYDSANSKVVIAYSDEDISNYGRAIVGTVSGDSISFGSMATFRTSQIYYNHIAYDTNAQKFLFVYSYQGSSGRSVVATVSGTSISFGSEEIWSSNQAAPRDIAYDANAQKFLMVFTDQPNTYDGTGVVATISGTSVSYGSEAVFASGTVQQAELAYNPDSGKFAISFSDQNDSSKLKSCVATVSGTSVSYGAAVTLTASSVNLGGICYNGDVDKIILTYENNSDGFIKSREGTMSGTSISFGTERTLLSRDTQHITNFIDTSTNTVVVAYRRKLPDPDTGDCFTYTAINSNLTSENYIGLSSNGYPDTAGATIDVQGAINDRQSGLTAGQSYYVQTDGTLDTTPASPSVFAGTAISATKMIVKG